MKIRVSNGSEIVQVPRGLEGVIVASTELTKIDGQAGRLVYRGYDVTELAGHVPYEAVAHLLWFGQLPNKEQLTRLQAQLADRRQLPGPVEAFLAGAAKSAESLSLLQTCVSIMGGLGNNDNESIVDASVGLTARMPSIVASSSRARQRMPFIAPRTDLGHAANYLYMLTGKVPDPQLASALDSYFTLLADHSISASTFVARIAASTLTDVYSAVLAAISALKGPLHGGAPIHVWEMLQSIGKPENARAWLTERLAKDERIMGFGHRVYRTEDPRSRVLKRIAKEIVDPELFELASTVETEARELLLREHPERAIDTNVEFYSSLVLHAVGIPPELFTCTFASARTVGWTAHIIEQRLDNRLFRPQAEYRGPQGLKLNEVHGAETYA
jgi:citrate synthase